MDDLIFGLSIAITYIWYKRKGRWQLFIAAMEGNVELVGSNAHGNGANNTPVTSATGTNNAAANAASSQPNYTGQSQSGAPIEPTGSGAYLTS
jgi:hypothetical protein